MDIYKDTLEHIIGIIVKSYAVIILTNLVALIICVVLKNRFNLKKIRVLLTVILICASLSAVLVLEPRLVDLNQNAFIVIEDGKLSVNQTNVLKNSGSIIFYGLGDAFSSNGNSIKLLGINFFELSPNPYEEYYGDIVYAKYSRQLIAIE